MTELFPLPLSEQIACVEREIELRRRVYARRVADRKMSRATADREIERMAAVLDTLIWLRDNAA
jgi:hypothetical protein